MEEFPEGNRPVILAVADTHVFFWYLFNQRKLSQKVREWFSRALETPQAQIGVSSISIVELTYMLNRTRVSKQDFDLAIELLRSGNGLFCAVPLTLDAALTVAEVDNQEIPDMPDRIIAATAKHLGVPLISADDWIVKSSVATIW